MSKSSRSKIKRANRAIKRQKNSKKEFAKLEKMVSQVKGTIEQAAEKKQYTVLGGEPVTEEEKMVISEEPTKTTKTKAVEGELGMVNAVNIFNKIAYYWTIMSFQPYKSFTTIQRQMPLMRFRIALCVV